MPIRARCENCKAVVILPDRMAGVEGICAQCKGPVLALNAERAPARPAPRLKKSRLRLRRRR